MSSPLINGARTLLQSACLVACWSVAISGIANAQNVQQQTVPNPQGPKTGGGKYGTGNASYMGSSRLNAHDSIVIQYPGHQCQSIINGTDKDLFVPWNTPGEFQRFLGSIGQGQLQSVSLSNGCCAPKTVTVCNTPNVPLGYRWLGTQLSNPQNPNSVDPVAQPALWAAMQLFPLDQNGNNDYMKSWSADNDVYGPIYASVIQNNQTIDYQVTYVCSNSTWVMTSEEGSCTPTNGQCSTLSGSTMTQLPQNLQTLCATGSIFQDLQTTPTGWTWQCAGTPGMTVASCWANNGVAGVCGPLNEPPPSSGPSYTENQMYAMTNSQLCSAGTWTGGFGGYGTSTWLWYCSGDGGGALSPPCYALSSSIAGLCGVDNGENFGSLTSLNATSPGLCESSQDTVVNFVAPSPPTNMTWTWTCDGYNNSTNSNCTATYNSGAGGSLINGYCGSDNGATFPPGTLSPTDPNLCGSGTVAYFESDPPYWQWSCEGINGGTTAACLAYQTTAINGVCGSDNGGTFPAGTLSPTDPNLCSAGTVVNFSGSPQNGPEYWQWVCQGSGNGGASPCYAFDIPGTNGQCGSAEGVATVNPPSAGLCSQGTASPVSYNNSSNQWLWTCAGTGSGTNANCDAPAAESNGACGPANGTAVPNEPNSNLCTTGVASPVTGSGPWYWTCQGTAGGQNSPQCEAYFCNACTGTLTSNQTTPRSGNVGSCTITGTAGWSETDTLIPGTASQATLTWNDPLGNFTYLISPRAAPWPNYCPPCYLQAQSASSASVTVNEASGASCLYSPGDIIPASNVNVTVIQAQPQ
jgi:hypothetical protein